MILVGIAHIVHLVTEEKDAKPAYATFFPRQLCISYFLLQRIERHTAILEADFDAVGFSDCYIQETVNTFRIGVRRHIHDNFLTSQPQRQGLF